MRRINVLTTAQVAQELGLSVRRVQTLAQDRGIGQLLTARQRVFTPSDVAKLRPGKPGRPRKADASAAAVRRRATREDRSLKE